MTCHSRPCRSLWQLCPRRFSRGERPPGRARRRARLVVGISHPPPCFGRQTRRPRVADGWRDRKGAPVSTPIGFHPAVAGGGARLRRRDLLIRAAHLGVALPAGSVLGAACGGGSSGASSAPATTQPTTGTPAGLDYAGWVGEDSVKNFE